MCGIVGLWRNDGWTRESPDLLARMIGALRHRGPDDAGSWVDAPAAVGLGHRRLAIVDLSPGGHQPMASPSGRYHITYNGEVYNFRSLRSALEREGTTFRSQSDTEVMLAAFERWGVRRAVERFDGMFAFALWDAAERTLFLVRDRLGEKPLYYATVDRTFVFGSELKALRLAGVGGVDRGALALYARHNYIPAPHTIHPGTSKVLPGTILAVRQVGARFVTTSSMYWSAHEAMRQGMADPIREDEPALVEACEQLLAGVIQREMVADVPLGAFLSGGTDSSTVVALMQRHSRRPVRTFTIGFSEAAFDEAPYGRAVAAHLGTEHTELYCTASEMLAAVPELPAIYDEPFADSSQIPTLLVSRLTRNHVTVSLSGDGGDELFGGYTRYLRGRWLARMRGLMPGVLRRTLATGLRLVPPRSDWAERLSQVGRLLGAETAQDMYRAVVSQQHAPERLVIDGTEPAVWPGHWGRALGDASLVQQMMYLDLVGYLPDDILVKVDRASMAVSLESRAPFLDHRVVEFAWRIPAHLKFRDGQGKWLLKQLLRRHLPEALIMRPKRGFAVPLGGWLRGPLREWAGDLLWSGRIADGYFDRMLLRELWRRQEQGSRRCAERLWTVLMFQAWRQSQDGTAPSGADSEQPQLAVSSTAREHTPAV